MVHGHYCADLVVILKTLPTHEAIRALGVKILEEVQNQQTEQSLYIFIICLKRKQHLTYFNN